MNAILLAAGYGTRLYPLTKDRPKSLLPVGGRPIIDYLVERLSDAPEVERMFLVSNARFVGDFQRWASTCNFPKPVCIYSDGSTSNDDRLGAVADIQFVLDQADISDEGAYVLATDNLPRFDLTDIIALSRQKGASAVFACPVANPEQLRRVGIAELDDAGRVVGFEEKPQHPKSNLRVPPFYVYTPEAVASVEAYLAEGLNPDAPGHFLEWLVPRCEVWALRPAEGTYDIGTLDSYRAVCAEFERRA
ncbi:MAG: nucleotidyltransferase family protein [Candidatus Brocadiae bacterium]|nr:nucleotidyltransferase family protein [Candidatus Brocadiia bacterium]